MLLALQKMPITARLNPKAPGATRPRTTRSRQASVSEPPAPTYTKGPYAARATPPAGAKPPGLRSRAPAPVPKKKKSKRKSCLTSESEDERPPARPVARKK